MGPRRDSQTAAPTPCPGDAWALFTQLDRDGDCEVSVEEFLEGAGRIFKGSMKERVVSTWALDGCLYHSSGVYREL